MFAFIYSLGGFLFTTLVIFLLFRLLRFTASRFIKKLKLKQNVLSILFGFEFIIWIILIYRIAEYSIATKPVLAFVMVFLLISITAWVFWFVLRDYLAGLYIRAAGRLKINQNIAFDDVKAEIISFADNYIVLEKENQSYIEVPYSKLLVKKIEYFSQSAEEEFSIRFELKKAKDKEVFIEKIKSKLLETPWINHQLEPKIILTKDSGKRFIELKIMLLDKKYQNKVEEALNDV
jgi:hypothetical protein